MPARPVRRGNESAGGDVPSRVVGPAAAFPRAVAANSAQAIAPCISLVQHDAIMRPAARQPAAHIALAGGQQRIVVVVVDSNRTLVRPTPAPVEAGLYRRARSRGHRGRRSRGRRLLGAPSRRRRRRGVAPPVGAPRQGPVRLRVRPRGGRHPAVRPPGDLPGGGLRARHEAAARRVAAPPQGRRQGRRPAALGPAPRAGAAGRPGGRRRRLLGALCKRRAPWAHGPLAADVPARGVVTSTGAPGRPAGGAGAEGAPAGAVPRDGGAHVRG
jgi:hypothetical protein